MPDDGGREGRDSSGAGGAKAPKGRPPVAWRMRTTRTAMGLVVTIALGLAGLEWVRHEPGGDSMLRAEAGTGRLERVPFVLPAGAKVLGTARGHITGLGGITRTDKVWLYGQLFEGSPNFYEYLYLTLVPGATGKPIPLLLPPAANSGYDPRLRLSDFTGDGLQDVLMVAPTGGSGGAQGYAAFSVPRGKQQLILDSETNAGISVTGQYLPDYRARVQVAQTRRNYVLDLSARKAFYDEMGVYKDGKLLQTVEPWAGPVGLLRAVPRPRRRSVSDLRLYQQIKGLTNADTIAQVNSLWRYTTKGWKLLSAPLKPVGDRLVR
jgi:hypothetical protein